MAERFDAYYDSIGCKSTGRHIHADGEFVLASDYAALEAMLANEVAENVRLRSREVGDEVGNLLQEVADLKNELARVKAESLRVVKVGEPCRIQEVDERSHFIDADGDLDFVDEGSVYIYPCTIVQPVRLERWEDEG